MATSYCNTFSISTPDCLLIQLSGSISADNAKQVEEDIQAIREDDPASDVVIDADDLAYISSAGLRVIMRLLKSLGKLTVRNVRPDVYDVFEMTGLTELIDVRRAPREIAIDGLEVIARGGQGTVYRLDEDTIVKLYRVGYSLDDIDRERRFARAALIAGVPTALSFDVVRSGAQYGVVFEHAGDQTLAHAFRDNPDRFGELIGRYVEFVREFQAVEVDEGTFEHIQDKFHRYIDNLKDYVSDEEFALMHELADCIPESTTLIHGDLHPGNIMVQGDELLLIDMPEVSQGPAQIDVVNLFRDLVSAPERSPEAITVSMDIPADLIKRIGSAFFAAYTGITDPAQLGQYFQGLGLVYALMVTFIVGAGGMGNDYIPQVLDGLLRGVVVPNQQALRGMLAQMV